ncbi:MAG TPA: PadR family transcriptional regulator [Armatimonadota bacterium]|jgi:DNA-binding PadR family transcriptional regulator
MSLEHAILGFLHYKPLTGYDLKAKFDASVRHFWPADQGQIYRTLSRLAEHGWTEVEVIAQEDRPDRKVYHITETGREELRQWLVAPLPMKGTRIAELVQIFFAGQLSDEEILAIFRRLAELNRQALAHLRQVQTQSACPDEQTRDCFFHLLTLEYGIYLTEANLRWFENVIARLERGEHRKGERA